MNKRLLLLLTICLILVSCTPIQKGANDQGNVENKGHTTENENHLTNLAERPSFPDIDDHWAKEEIIYLRHREIIGGYPTGDFGPNDDIQRVHAALMIQRELNFDTTNRPDPAFLDVTQDHPDYDVIATLADEGIFTGDENGNFNPNDSLNRAEMAAILQRTFHLEGEGHFQFYDVPSDFWGLDEIQTLVANQITIGYPDRSFKPRNNITRAEFSTFMARALDERFRVEIEETVTDDELEVHFLGVGQGDASFIELPNGKTILIDAGTQTAGEKVVSYLQKAGISSIDLVVATHAHADHIGGLLPVLQEIEVKNILDSGRTHTSQTYLNYLGLVDEKEIPLEVAEVGSQLDLDQSVQLTVLNTGDEQKSLNNSSVALKLDYDEVSILFTGDAEQAIEEEMVNSFDLSSDILQVGHHGSRTSSTEVFLANVKPKEAVLSYGEGNRYNHPHEEVVQRFNEQGINLYSTATSEDIIVVTDGRSYEVKNSPWDGAGNPEGSTGDEESHVFPININTANEEELQQITGIGPEYAKRIIDYRQTYGPFTTIEDIQNVSGIGPVTFEGMKDQIIT
ncbi:S-layer homology domain-containing protein [Desertibacillus haloalkaliphilus]|uniref:S-layer homology domain-containing protein n=1 Tax=Desertibacillus haloalkaliphilus TaxID=1328930 RepID=UPI001C2761F1|nr:S-layer homology domain-containing protein [Desertibacillus haloalkaliphilus]MBU8907629.1 S-layer homology domain-containing protein [Desertibacillus haloalkaliphilus]